MGPIRDLRALIRDSQDTECFLCSRGGIGTLCCSFKNCSIAFHLTCAQLQGLYRDEKTVCLNGRVQYLCPRHGRPRVDSEEKIQALSRLIPVAPLVGRFGRPNMIAFTFLYKHRQSSRSTIVPDFKCAICLSMRTHAGDIRITCSTCGGMAHGMCYGVKASEFVPGWRCLGCILSSENKPNNCVLCPHKGGFLQPVSHESTPIGENYAHILCAFWTGVGSVKNLSVMKPLQLTMTDDFQPCQACHQRMGVKFECTKFVCQIKYHITCAVKENIMIRSVFGKRIPRTIMRCPEHDEQRYRELDSPDEGPASSSTSRPRKSTSKKRASTSHRRSISSSKSAPSSRPRTPRTTPKRPRTQTQTKSETNDSPVEVIETNQSEYQIRPTRTRNITPSISRFDPSIVRTSSRPRSSKSVKQESTGLSPVTPTRSTAPASSSKRNSSSAKSSHARTSASLSSIPPQSTPKSIALASKSSLEPSKQVQNLPRRVLRGLVFKTQDGSNEEDAVCNVCFNPESYDEDEILFCDRCNVAVHQSCYGVSKIPEGEWFCDRCRVNGAAAAKCVLCHMSGGAMRKSEDGRWCHMACVIWNSEMAVKNMETMSDIMSPLLLSRNQKFLECAFCLNRGGGCVKCSEPGCQQTFHITCARMNGYETRHAVELDGSVSLRPFCSNHSKVLGKATVDMSKVTVIEIVRTHLKSYIKTMPVTNELLLEMHSKTPQRPLPRIVEKVVITQKTRPERRIEVEKRMPLSVIDLFAQCCVCFSRVESKAAVLKCSQCDILVHSICYGAPNQLPSQTWKCDRCQMNRNQKSAETCVLCPIAKGAFKKCDSSWVHLTCALWTSGVHFGSEVSFQPILGVDSVIANQKAEKPCSVCGESGGHCLPCAVSGCENHFHVYCGKLTHLRMLYWRGSKREHTMRQVFCGDHSWVDKRTVEKMKVSQINEYFALSSLMSVEKMFKIPRHDLEVVYRRWIERRNHAQSCLVTQYESYFLASDDFKNVERRTRLLHLRNTPRVPSLRQLTN